MPGFPQLCRDLNDHAEALVTAKGMRGAAYTVAQHGEVIAEGYFGCETDSAFNIMSTTKTLQNAALWPLLADGRLKLDARVAEIVPEFGTNGKEAITVEHVMLHLGCFAMQPLAFPEGADSAVRKASYAAWKLEGVPGERYQYHPGNGAWVLADVAEAVSAEKHLDLVNKGLLERAGLFGADKLALGLPADTPIKFRDVSSNLTEEQYALMPVLRPDPVTGQSPMLGRANLASSRALGMPGAGGTGTVRALALLYQQFLNDPKGLWDPDIRLMATRQVRLRMPGSWGKSMQRSLGFYIAGEADQREGEGAFFGAGVSAEAFGHEGHGGQIVWADPACGLSFVFLTDTTTFTPFERAMWPYELSTMASRLAQA